MAEAGDQGGEVMGPAELKPLLHLAKRKAVSCAIGMTKDKQGVILLHKRTKPRKLMAELLRQGKSSGLELDRTTIRFGRASVDGGSDSSTVVFTVNKAAPGPLRMALVAKLRPAGFQRCEIVVDEAIENESDEDEPEEGEEATAPPLTHEVASSATPPFAAPDAPAIIAASTQAIRPAAASPNADPALGNGAGATRQAADAQPNAPTLRTTLRGLTEQIRPVIAADPSRGRLLVNIATAARDNLANGDLTSAQSGIASLHQALVDASVSAGASPGNPQSRPDTISGGTGMGAARASNLIHPVNDAGGKARLADASTLPPPALGFVAPAIAPALESSALGGVATGLLVGGAVGGLLLGPQMEVQAMAAQARSNRYWAAYKELGRIDPTNRLAGPYVSTPEWKPSEADVEQMLKAVADAKKAIADADAATMCSADNSTGTPGGGIRMPDFSGIGDRSSPAPALVTPDPGFEYNPSDREEADLVAGMHGRNGRDIQNAINALRERRRGQGAGNAEGSTGAGKPPLTPLSPLQPNLQGFRSSLAAGDIATAASKFGTLAIDTQLDELATLTPENLQALHTALRAAYGEGSQLACMADPAHRADLTRDPATSLDRPNERDTALRLERVRGVQLKRHAETPQQKGDFIDQDGKTYDGCSPPRSAHFDGQVKPGGGFEQSLRKHLNATPPIDYIVIDISGLKLTPAQVQALDTLVSSVAGASNLHIIRIP